MSLEAGDSTKIISWTTTDLCTECTALDLEAVLAGGPPVSILRNLTPRCPLCLFLGERIRHGAPASGSVTSEYRIQSMPITETNCIYLNFRSSKLQSKLRRSRVLVFSEMEGDVAFYSDCCCIFRISDKATTHPPLIVQFLQLRKDYIEYGILKEWLTSCKEFHSGVCSPPSDQQFEKLKVIDCTRREDIHVPHTTVPMSDSAMFWAHRQKCFKSRPI